jgi:DNA primase
MDVIALSQAGFAHTVATLGTAFTERQMELLWQLAPEPIVCFDGDRAGEAAAARAIDRMLPNLREGRSFRFAFLPQGSDPDDLVRAKGARALAECLAGARPLIDVLWQRELKAHTIDTPERRAAFEERLERLLAEIGNARVKEHYRREVKNRLFNLWREQTSPRGRLPVKSGAQPAARTSPAPIPSARGFVTVLVIALVNHPWLLDRFADEVASLEIRDKKLAGLLKAVTGLVYADPHITREDLAPRLADSTGGELYAELSRDSAFKRVAFLQPETPEREVAEQFSDLIYRFRALPSLNRELQEGADHLADMTDAEFERFAMLQQQVASVGSQHTADDAGDSDAQKRFRETVARLRQEHRHRGHRRG